jgi:hypothetical protein
VLITTFINKLKQLKIKMVTEPPNPELHDPTQMYDQFGEGGLEESKVDNSGIDHTTNSTAQNNQRWVSKGKQQ